MVFQRYWFLDADQLSIFVTPVCVPLVSVVVPYFQFVGIFSVF